MDMARRGYGWLLAALLLLPPVIKVIEFLDSLFPREKGHMILELPDEGQHGHMPSFLAPPPPPFVANGSLDAANQAVIARAAVMLRGHPAYLGFATQPL